MLVCDDNNPNIIKFIERKKTAGYLSGANISVGVSDVFMAQVKAAEAGSTKSEDLAAKAIWDVIIESAWSSAEPGIIWMERYNNMSNSHFYNEGLIVATNP